MQNKMSDFEFNGFQSPLRPSLFDGLPPFINYVPSNEICDVTTNPPQYWDVNKKWDQEQLWRFATAMQNWVLDRAASENQVQRGNGKEESFLTCRSHENSIERISNEFHDKKATFRKMNRWSAHSLVIKQPFEERANDAASFREMHLGVLLVQFPKLHQICRKNYLGENYASMRRKFPQDYQFHPLTFTLPQDLKKLSKMMTILENKKEKLRKNEPILWIVKPPNKCKGTGIKVVSNSVQDIPNYPTCVQKYVKNPFLIDGYKFDIRLYVLVTSLEPLRLYLYDDGLVRIATEKYTETVDKISDSCVHICNFAINCKNTENFRHNSNPSECQGNKWRLRCLWKYLAENCFISYDQIETLWEEMKDIVIKTLLISHKETCDEFIEVSPMSMYNCYKLLGFDVLIDNDLKVHLMEVNSRPELKDDIIDKTVNRPMLDEMIKIIGFHIPKSCEKQRQFLQKIFNLRDKTEDGKHWPVTFQSRQYTRKLNQNDKDKQKIYYNSELERKMYLNTILEDLTPADIRYLVKMEEERSVIKSFERIFPTNETYKYFKFFGEHLPYFDKLYDAYETAFWFNRKEGIQKLQKFVKMII